ncbi:hypothetical protein GCM10017567_76000 [Amycolatopsis bullii]|uniref:Uncharacterized protein n=1 Tax=Amycolatopsis bullii TaxID=941987 RepID=A0ABQ3KPL3_9PSEU|nr:hypothetical protein GCM10017567_76000 [Amycolatopsis bullii]
MVKLLRPLISLALALGVTAIAVPGTPAAAGETAYVTKTRTGDAHAGKPRANRT